MTPVPRYRTSSAALICFGISITNRAAAVAASGKTTNLRFGFTGTTLNGENQAGENACFRGWASTCQDDPTYISKFGLSCEGHGFFQCELFLDLGFTPLEVSELITSCPCSCSINCSDDSWKAVIGLDRLDQPEETVIDALEESSTPMPTTIHPTQYPTNAPSSSPTTMAPTVSPSVMPTTLIPSSTPTKMPSLNPTTMAPTVSPSVAPTAKLDNAIVAALTPSPTGFSTTLPDSKTPTRMPTQQPVESATSIAEIIPHHQPKDIPKAEARAEIPTAESLKESGPPEAKQDESTDINGSSRMTLTLMELILICVGMVAISLTLLVAHGVYRRSKAVREEENPSEKVDESLHKQLEESGKKKNKNKNRKSRKITRVVRGLGTGGKRKGESSTADGPVIREGAAVVIASSTRSRCNHEALLVESFSSVSDSQASTLHRKRGPHRNNNRVHIPRDVCELPSNLVLEAE